METIGSCTIAIGATEEAEQKANSVIDDMYEGYVSHLVVVRYLVMPHVRHVYVLLPIVRPHVRHVCVLLPLARPHVRHARLGLHIAVSLKGIITHI